MPCRKARVGCCPCGRRYWHLWLATVYAKGKIKENLAADFWMSVTLPHKRVLMNLVEIDKCCATHQDAAKCLSPEDLATKSVCASRLGDSRDEDRDQGRRGGDVVRKEPRYVYN